MPTILKETSLLTTVSNPNVNTGSVFETARRKQTLSIGVTQAATGLKALINIGADVVAEEFDPPILTLYPSIPDLFFFQDMADPGDRIVIAVRNPTGGTLVFRTVTIITE